MKCQCSLSPEKCASCITLNQELSSTGLTTEKLSLQETSQDIEDILLKIASNPKFKEKYVTAESQLLRKKKIWRDKLTSSELSILDTKLLLILDQESISREKDLTPFWTSRSMEMSKRLWLPTKIDCVDSVLNSSKESSKRGPMGSSWFSIKQKHPPNKSLQETSFLLSQYSLPDSMDSEAIKLKKSSLKAKSYKTMKFRLFPTEEEVVKITKCLEQFRWYYNANVDIIYKMGNKQSLIDNRELKYEKVRDTIRNYTYQEHVDEINGVQCITKGFIYDPTRNEVPIPQWMDKVHSRIPRGASKKFTQNINSCISNVRNGNYKDFHMHFMTKKEPMQFMLFEDAQYPTWINNIKSHYWYRTKERKRITVSYNDIRQENSRGFEIIYDKLKNQYFLHCPVEIDFFPKESIRIERQIKYTTQKERVISLDPGIRKFLVGYDPSGVIVEIGGGECRKKIIDLLLQVDTEPKNIQEKTWRRIKGLVEELHKKTASFLVENYDTILLPDFRVQGMIRKRTLGKMTKRVMTMLSFYKFRTYLEFKCKQYLKKLIIVDESYTSKTCTSCGALGNWKSKEFIECECGLKIDRDVAGSRNIFIKNMKLL